MMKLKIPDDLQILISKKYLDWAEMLPKSNRGAIHRLQVIREGQLATAEEWTQKSKPPEGTELKYLYVRLIEMYHIEDFEKLQDGLLRLFHSLNDDSPIDRASFKYFFENMAHSAVSVGRIFRENDFCVLPYSIISELPPEVDFIDVAMHKTLPSTIFITLDVHLTDLASRNLHELQRGKYLSEIKFTSLIPWKIKIHSIKHEDSVMKRQVRNWLISKRRDIEQCIRPYLGGFFMQQQINEQARLPAIDVYAIKGMPIEEKAFEEWRNKSRSWWDSFGFKFYADIHSNGEFLFIGSDSASHCIIPFDPGPPDDEDFLPISDFMDSILICTILIEYLSSLQLNIEKLRNNVFTSMAKWFPGPNRLKRHFERHDKIRRESVFLERISMEFGHHSDFIRHQMKAVEDYKIIKIPPNEDDDANLRDVLFISLKNKIKGLNKHLSLLSKSFSEYLGMRNMEAIYYLTWWMFFMALITLITTLTGPCKEKSDESLNKEKSSEIRPKQEGTSPSPTEIRR